jgi:photosystem I P700 chlorophyll a apoprotein A2
MSKDLRLKLLYTPPSVYCWFLNGWSCLHGAIFVRDYDPELNKDNVLARMLEHKEAIISHLSWVYYF